MTDTLKLASVAFTDSGSYKVILVNTLAGSPAVVSNSATLMANPVSILAGGVTASFAVRNMGSSVSFRLPSGVSGARIVLMDVWGRTVWSRNVASGTNEISWDGSSLNGRRAAPGLYMVQVRFAGQASGIVQKITYTP